jgi:hypothetical protein
LGKAAVSNSSDQWLIAGMVDSSYSVSGNTLVNLDLFALIVDDADGDIHQEVSIGTGSLVDVKPLRYGVSDKPDITYAAIRSYSPNEYIISTSTEISGLRTPRIIRCRINGVALVQNNAPTNLDWNEPTFISGAEISNTLDNNYALVGTTGNLAGSSDLYYIKLNALDLSKSDSRSNIIATSAASPYTSTGSSIFPTSDGGYAVLGSTNNTDITGSAEKLVDVVLYKLNPDGTEQWHKVFGGRGNDIASKVIQTTDGGYLICGTIAFGDDISNSGSSNVISLIKLNNEGEISNIQ